ncbi:hypothetical protein AJ80_02505 [Polytolypa hystricis UAMH7299]|uniref:Low temperature viability protein n=1 Tax=Polytolypa hystricis (strain UAMH7299) TaxID=1447883 RepID=A0A2B7YQ28_POLH7|nr:hypothetical protein AJ80_02505 [Polytolypa hystricis UAMH7299]
MPPRKQWIDKKSATTYQLFHRPQHDPLIHDPEAQDRVLHRVAGPPPPTTTSESSSSSSKISKHLADLEEEFEGAGVRKNEGEAANYGVYYDDSKYDYMQHMRDLGEGGGHFVEVAAKGKGKAKQMSLEDALRQSTLDDVDASISMRGPGSLYDADGLSTASTFSRKPTYEDQQNIPDTISGFQPDMDPRLREALEALEDEEFVEMGSDEDIFAELVKGGDTAEMDPSDWRDTYIEDDEDDGWESDVTEKAPVQHSTSTTTTTHLPEDIEDGGVSLKKKTVPDDTNIPDTTPTDDDWLKNFAQYKKDMKSSTKKPITPSARGMDNASDLRSAASTMFTAGGTPIRRKKRKGALTNPSAYSMTSSSIARTEGHRLLDDRFERIEALYTLDEEGDEFLDDGSSMVDGVSVVSGMSKFSQAPSLVSEGGSVALREDFDSIMDGFLGGWSDRSKQAKRKGAKGKRGKNGNEALGIMMLDEVREGLGPARVRGKV